MHTTGTSALRPKQRLPACPATPEVGMCGKSPYGILTMPWRVSANPPRPLPRTTPTIGEGPEIRFRTANTQSSRRAPIDDGGDCEIGGMVPLFRPGARSTLREFFDESLADQSRRVPAHVSGVARDFAYQRRADEAVLRASRQEHGVHRRLEIGVGVGDLELVLEVRRRAKAAHDDASALALTKVDEEPFES